ncbi:MAG: SsrA-binding protein SmpB [Oscillospiraceae bacterium]|nr:SsrA-binding protein SmpB [Oscillospiraceae bacterium]
MGETISVNRQARHEYFVLETYEAGIELYGTEIKSIRTGSVNLKEAWADIQNGQVYIYGMHISPYEKGNIFNKDPFRVRRLLLHKKEIIKLSSKIQQDGLTLVPLSLYYKNQYVKVELGLCKGKKLYDKREADAKKNAKRDIDRALKTQSRR